ncbi:DUF6551 family protein [Mycolicibacter algericus]|uniref:ParB/Sulfiredoxin domain-containing protein n=1 Tax=Mycolicibacter algericus TaxID=1288388 RepID=A0A7I9YGX7_MYCAL|nr:DUF6551 family protein [Mycolicibacter algericus]GFG87894.1 hypothetical protein MALGJ_45700 [Mycolicibacter algericus]
MTAAAADPDVYVTAIHTSDVFVDTTYQRPCDPARARAMARDWNPRLAGIIEVSDRGPTNLPRYAIIDGQHRWAAAQLLDDPPTLVANVHTGLTVADEAKLFDQLNRARKKVNVFEHYKARLAVRLDHRPHPGRSGQTRAHRRPGTQGRSHWLRRHAGEGRRHRRRAAGRNPRADHRHLG